MQLGKDNSYLCKINKGLIAAARYFETRSPIYERNQHFASFKMVYDMKFYPIPFNEYLRGSIFDLNFFYNNFLEFYISLLELSRLRLSGRMFTQIHNKCRF